MCLFDGLLLFTDIFLMASPVRQQCPDQRDDPFAVPFKVGHHPVADADPGIPQEAGGQHAGIPPGKGLAAGAIVPGVNFEDIRESWMPRFLHSVNVCCQLPELPWGISPVTHLKGKGVRNLFSPRDASFL